MGKPIYEMTSIELILLLQETESQELRNRIILELTPTSVLSIYR